MYGIIACPDIAKVTMSLLLLLLIIIVVMIILIIIIIIMISIMIIIISSSINPQCACARGFYSSPFVFHSFIHLLCQQQISKIADFYATRED